MTKAMILMARELWVVKQQGGGFLKGIIKDRPDRVMLLLKMLISVILLRKLNL